MHESRLVHSTHPPIDRLDANARVLCARARGDAKGGGGVGVVAKLTGHARRGVVVGVGWGGVRATGVGGGCGVGSARGVRDSTRCVCVCVMILNDDFE